MAWILRDAIGILHGYICGLKCGGVTTLLRCKLLICSRVSFSKSEMVLGGEVLDLQCICTANSSMNREKFHAS